MIVMPANNSNAHKLEKQYPGRMGLLLGPSGWRDPKSLTYACDNDCFSVWSKGKAWDEGQWWAMLEKVNSCDHRPRWVAIPDVVGDAVATYQRWAKYAPEVADRFSFPLALVVQDGMTPESTREFLAASTVQPTAIFIGGTTDWKRKTLWHWCHTFERVHVGRVNTEKWLWNAHRCGAESVDGTGFFRGDKRQLAGLHRYLRRSSAGLGTGQQELEFAECEALTPPTIDVP